jgi:hypothetical protein
MNTTFMDVIPAKNGSPRMYTVKLLGYRNGAAPEIERIGAEVLLERLQDVMGWPETTITRLRDYLAKNGRLSNESLDSPTTEQLQKLGFIGLETETK